QHPGAAPVVARHRPDRPGLRPGDERADPAGRAVSAVTTQTAVRLSVPYISQLVNGSGGNNCGPACLSMCLAYRGVIAPTQEAMLECADVVRDGALDGAGRTGGYTTLQQLQTAAGWYGQACWWPMSWTQIDESVRRGEPVIILLDNRVL